MSSTQYRYNHFKSRGFSADRVLRVIIYPAGLHSVRRWYYKQESTRRDHHARQDDTGAAATSAAYVDTEKNQRVATAAAAFPTPSKYALVVEKSTALAEGRRFDLPCGREVVIGRSQHLADIVVKDEMVSSLSGRKDRGPATGFCVVQRPLNRSCSTGTKADGDWVDGCVEIILANACAGICASRA